MSLCCLTLTVSGIGRGRGCAFSRWWLQGSRDRIPESEWEGEEREGGDVFEHQFLELLKQITLFYQVWTSVGEDTNLPSQPEQT